MLQVTITKDTVALDNLIECFSNPDPFLEYIGLGADELIRRNIEHGTAADGSALAPNAPLTIDCKAGLDTPLMASKQLKDTITHVVQGKSVTSGSGIVVGGKYPLLAIHQEGATIKAKNVPYLMIPANAFTARRMKGSGSEGEGGERPKKGKVRVKYKGKKAKVQTQYLSFRRLKEVTIPARKVLPEGDIAQYPDWQKMIDRCVNRFLKLEKA